MNLVLRDIRGVVFLVFFSVLLAFLYNHFSPFGIALFGQWEPSTGVVNAISKNDTIDFSIEINHPILIQQIVEKKERVILDARHKDFYSQGHIPGALSYPLVDFDEDPDQLLKTIGKDTPILVYCSSIECTDSHTLASNLIALNYTNVKVFAGGFRQWVEMGLKIEKNEE